MFLELKEVKNLGLEVVRDTTLDVEELGELIEDYQCSLNLVSDMNIDIFRYFCLNKGVNFNELASKMDESNIHDSGNEDLKNALNEASKYMYFSIEGKYSNNEEIYPKIDFLTNIFEFQNKANGYSDIIGKLDLQLDEKKITEDEYDTLTSAAYIELGCNIYHEKYLNEDKFDQCIENGEEIKDDNYIAGFVKLYIIETEQDKINKCFTNIENILNKKFELKYN